MSLTNKRKNLLGFFLVFGPALFLIFISTRGCNHQFKKLDDYGALKNYSFTDSKGKLRHAEEFKGDCSYNYTSKKLSIGLFRFFLAIEPNFI